MTLTDLLEVLAFISCILMIITTEYFTTEGGLEEFLRDATTFNHSSHLQRIYYACGGFEEKFSEVDAGCAVF